MFKRCPVAQLIGRHLASFRKSQRKTICDMTLGLLRKGQVGEAAIARGMLPLATVRHCIKRIWRFCRNERI